MCEIVYLPPGVGGDAESRALVEADLRRTCEVNNEGFGLAMVFPAGTYKRELYAATGMDAEEMISHFLGLRRAFPFAPAAFHARLATTGKVCLDECHPILAQDGHVAVFLQGTLDMRLDDGESDTRAFADQYAEGFNPGDVEWRMVVDELVKRTNARLLMMGDQWYDPVHLFNRDAWVMTPYGALASNASHLGRPKGWDERTDPENGHVLRCRYRIDGRVEVAWDETERIARTRP